MPCLPRISQWWQTITLNPPITTTFFSSPCYTLASLGLCILVNSHSQMTSLSRIGGRLLGVAQSWSRLTHTNFTCQVTRQIDFSRVTGLSCKGSWNFDQCLAPVSARVLLGNFYPWHCFFCLTYGLAGCPKLPTISLRYAFQSLFPFLVFLLKLYLAFVLLIFLVFFFRVLLKSPLFHN